MFDHNVTGTVIAATSTTLTVSLSGLTSVAGGNLLDASVTVHRVKINEAEQDVTSSFVPVATVINPTRTTVTTSNASPTYGQSVTLTATVTEPYQPTLTPAGTVQFYDGSTPLGSAVTLESGVATYTTASLSAGQHHISAVYSGDASDDGNTGLLLDYVTASVVKTGSYNVHYSAAVAVDNKGDRFIVDQYAYDNYIVEVNAAGSASVVNTGSYSLNAPSGVAVDGKGDLFIADSFHNRIVKVTDYGKGQASVVPTPGYTLYYPEGVAVDTQGDLFICDYGKKRVVEVSAAGGASVINTGPYSLSSPVGVAVDGQGDLFIADPGNGRVVKVNAAGSASVVNTGSYSLINPAGVAADEQGDLFIADPGNDRIFEVSAAGSVSVVNTDSFTLNRPADVAVDGQGDLFIADNIVDPQFPTSRIVEVSSALPVTKRPITVSADAQIKTVGGSDPTLTYQITSGNLVGSDALSGSLTRDPGETVGAYLIHQGSLSADPNYNLTFVPSVLFITSATTSLDSAQSVLVTSGGGPSHAQTTPASQTAPQLIAIGDDLDGVMTVAQFLGDPQPGFKTSGSFFDLDVESGDVNSQSSVQITLTNLTPNVPLLWWNGSVWEPVTDASGNPVVADDTGTAKVTFTNATSPTLSQLRDAEFFAGVFTPTITAAPGTTVALGTGDPLTASATLQGGNQETGMIMFTLYGPDGNQVETESVAVSGDGKYSTPHGFVPTVAGAYQWVASYSGDNDNQPNSTSLGDTPEAAVGPGATLVGTVLYLVGGNKADQIEIDPLGTSKAPLPGISIDAHLAGSHDQRTYATSPSAIVAYLFDGNDHVDMAPSLDIPAVVIDGDGNDHVTLGDGNNAILLGNGNDQVQAGDGSNLIALGNGNDHVTLGNGNNIVVAGGGNDHLKAGDGDNSVTLGNGNDKVEAGSGNNVITVGTGHDQVNAGSNSTVQQGAAQMSRAELDRLLSNWIAAQQYDSSFPTQDIENRFWEIYAQDNPANAIAVKAMHSTAQPLVDASLAPGQIINAVGSFGLADDVYVIGSGVVNVSADNGVLKNDTAPSALTVTAATVSGVNGGVFVFHADGSFTYTSPANFPGFDSAQYTASDAQGDTATATVNVLSQTGGVAWKLYESVLNRDPDPAGLQHAIDAFLHGGKAGDIAAGFFESDELLNQIITGYYQQYLHRSPDDSGLAHWRQVWHATGGPEIIKAGFADSPEFYASAGGTPEDWITELYRRILDREPDAQGKQYWLDYLASHGNTAATRGYIALGFFTSLEAYKGDVTAWFQEYLQRAPTTSELNQYAGEMQAGKTDREIEQELADLPEYLQNPPSAQASAGVRLPDYFPQTASSGNKQQAAAKDSVFAKLGS